MLPFGAPPLISAPLLAYPPQSSVPLMLHPPSLHHFLHCTAQRLLPLSYLILLFPSPSSSNPLSPLSSTFTTVLYSSVSTVNLSPSTPPKPLPSLLHASCVLSLPFHINFLRYSFSIPLLPYCTQFAHTPLPPTPLP